MRIAYSRTRIMARNLKNKKNEKYTLYELGYGEYTEKLGKLDTHTVGPGIWQEK